MNRRPAPRWLVCSAVAVCLGVGAGGGWLTSRHQAQQASERRGVQACDAGWEVCRVASGRPVADAHGCRWLRLEDEDAYTFAALDGKGGWNKCQWFPEPAEEAEEDQSPCGAAWRQCFGVATRGQS